MSSFFSFLASSSFIYIDHFGLTPTQYSFAFSVNADRLHRVFAICGEARRPFRHGARRDDGRDLFAAIATALFVVTLAGVDSLAVLIVMLFCGFAFLGLVIPTTMVLALDEHGPIAGMASALGGTLQMVTGALMIVVVSAFFDGTALPMVTTIAACAIGATVLAHLTLGRGRGFATAPAE